MIIAYAGEEGSYSHLACQSELFKNLQAIPFRSFAEALDAVQDGRADRAMIPIENPIGGRVTEVHSLLRCSWLYIVAEHFQPVDHCLLVSSGTTIGGIKRVKSHYQALDQCGAFLRRLNVRTIQTTDTASAAREVAEAATTDTAAIASSVAAATYRLRILRRGIQDLPGNTTRFVVFSRQPINAPPKNTSECWITACLFQLPHVAAALYTALGALASNEVSLTKIESYMTDASFKITRIYLEFAGHPNQPPVGSALEQLRSFSQELRIVGTFKAHPYRNTN